MTRILLSLLALSVPVVAAAELPTLAELAARADVVAVVQLVHTEYRPRTGPPKAGFALLRVLIPYKRLDRQDLLAVYAEDTDPNPCFYPTEPDADERYLVFFTVARTASTKAKRRTVGFPCTSSPTTANTPCAGRLRECARRRGSKASR